MARVMIFIDGSNFYNGMIANCGKVNFDFYKFASKLSDGRNFIRTYYYNVTLPKQYDETKCKKQQKFFSYMSDVPYLTLKYGRLEQRSAGFIEKGVDIMIAVDMLTLGYQNTYDTAILVSGDGDFVSAVVGVQNLGKHVENAYFKRGQSQNLKKTCDKFTLLDKNYLESCI